MSERGSFCTEYIYCGECLAVVAPALSAANKGLNAAMLPIHGESGHTFPIVAGKLGGLHAGEELEIMHALIEDHLEGKLCHDLKIAVLPQSGAATIFTVVAGPTKLHMIE
jgi:hypothetical protein